MPLIRAEYLPSLRVQFGPVRCAHWPLCRHSPGTTNLFWRPNCSSLLFSPNSPNFRSFLNGRALAAVDVDKAHAASIRKTERRFMSVFMEQNDCVIYFLFCFQIASTHLLLFITYPNFSANGRHTNEPAVRFGPFGGPMPGHVKRVN